jgi:phosphatidylinositol alpha 1,6-mannosyltransferase
MTPRRVAFFTDSFHEVNGVALTSREFAAFAQRRSVPMFSVHAGPEDRRFQDGSIKTFEFKRSRVRWTLERDLAIDLLFLRLRRRLREALAEFRPDVVHITGPGDAGILGALLAYELRVPLVASWHTNLHEFGARRLWKFLSFLPVSARTYAAHWAEKNALDQCVRFYRLARLLLAPNPDLVEMLGRRTGRPAFLMTRGIDTHLYSPVRRTRSDGTFRIGYVGRLSPEKNVRMLVEIEARLIQAGISNYSFLIVGEGSERGWLKHEMQRAELPGVLRGQELAQAYASMDVFAFPSSTDTFGNVVLEAMASGVPAIVTPDGGPKFLVTPGHDGYVVEGAEEFADIVMTLANNMDRLGRLRRQARRSAERFSWDAVFERVMESYETCFPETALHRRDSHTVVTELV